MREIKIFKWFIIAAVIVSVAGSGLTGLSLEASASGLNVGDGQDDGESIDEQNPDGEGDEEGAVSEEDEDALPEDSEEADAPGSFQGNGDQSVFDEGLNDGRYFADFNFDGVQTLNGIMSSVGMYLNLPDYCIAESATFRFSYTCSDLINED